MQGLFIRSGAGRCSQNKVWSPQNIHFAATNSTAARSPAAPLPITNARCGRAEYGIPPTSSVCCGCAIVTWRGMETFVSASRIDFGIAVVMFYLVKRVMTARIFPSLSLAWALYAPQQQYRTDDHHAGRDKPDGIHGIFIREIARQDG